MNLGFFLMLALFIAQIYWLIRQPDKFRDCIFIYVFLSSLTEAGAMGTGPNTLTVLWLMSLAMSVCRPLATTAQSIDRAAT